MPKRSSEVCPTFFTCVWFFIIWIVFVLCSIPWFILFIYVYQFTDKIDTMIWKLRKIYTFISSLDMFIKWEIVWSMIQKDHKIKICSSSAKFLCKILVFFYKVLGQYQGNHDIWFFFFSKILFNKKKRDNFPFMKICIKHHEHWRCYFRWKVYIFQTTFIKIVI